MTETKWTFLLLSLSIGALILIFTYQIIKKRIDPYIFILQLIIAAVLTFAEGYWFIKPYEHSVSCMDCMLELDLFWLSMVAGIVTGLFLLASNGFRMMKLLQSAISTVLLFCFWWEINNILFLERADSINTFTGCRKMVLYISDFILSGFGVRKYLLWYFIFFNE